MSTGAGARTDLAIVLTGLPDAAAHVTAQRYIGRGYRVAIADIADASSVDDGLAIVRTAMATLRSRGAAVAVAGYDDGGRYAYLAVTRLGAVAALAFRGLGIADHLAEAQYVKAPLSLHFADDDLRIPFADVRRVKGALEGFGTVEIYRYAVWDPQTAEQAERRGFAVLDGLRVPSG